MLSAVRSAIEVLETVSSIAEEAMGGSAGAMYSILFATAAAELRKTSAGGSNDPDAVFTGLRRGVDAVMKYGGAAPGDRTMLDAIVPGLEAFGKGEELDYVARLEKMAAAAEKGAAATKDMMAAAGRASYVAKEELKNPDPGAHAVGIVCRAIYQAAKAVFNQ